MKRFSLTALLFALCLSVSSFAQEDALDTEFGDANESSPSEFSEDSGGPVVGTSIDGPAYVESVPEAPRGFVRPPGPKKGGVLQVPHPQAAKGLLRIEKDGAYQYKTQEKDKNQATSIRIASTTPPKISGVSNLSFKDLYGSGNLLGLMVDYEWQPFRGFGALGLQLGSGLIMTRGNGRFADLGIADEVYDLYVIPLSVFAVYRFEYVRHQWFVPYINGGGTMYGLIEKRDDSKPATVSSAQAVGFGGGVHISISRWDPQGAFIMQKEYGVSDLWLTLEARITQGIPRNNIDFTNQTASLGITVDY